MKKVSALSVLAATTLSCNPMTTSVQPDAGNTPDAGQETSYIFDVQEIKVASKINPQVKKIYIAQQ